MYMYMHELMFYQQKEKEKACSLCKEKIKWSSFTISQQRCGHLKIVYLVSLKIYKSILILKKIRKKKDILKNCI